MKDEKKVRKPRRTKKAVEQDILSAVGSVLEKHGIAKLGINLVAEEASIDKKVIYRHYGTFEKLLEAYLNHHDYWITALSKYNSRNADNDVEQLKGLIISQLDTIYSNNQLQELLIWELADKTELTKQIAQKRELLAQSILSEFEHLASKARIDINSVGAILVSAIYFLVLHRNISTMCWVDINKPEDRERVRDSILFILDTVFEEREKRSETERIALNAFHEGIDISTIQKITGLDTERLALLNKNIESDNL